MAFNPLIPQAIDQLSVSQGQILANFTALGPIAGNANPTSSSINATAGFNWLYLPPTGAIPPAGATFAAGNIGLYSAQNPNTLQNELYINKTNHATVVQVPASASILSTNSAPANNSTGWTYLPSGILLKWGFIPNPIGALPIGILYPVGATIPAFTGVIQVMISPYDTTGTVFDHVFVVSQSNNVAGFQINCNVAADAGIALSYFAIGY